jgi:agmatinase
MASMKTFFADAESSFEDAYIAILGVPFDGTTSHRKGTALAPDAIREESYNFETYLFEHDVDMEDVPIHDLGNIPCLNMDDMLSSVGSTVEKILKAGKFPVILGGEHSLTHPAAGKYGDVGVVILDAHLDFRDSYLDEPHSHACTTRRIFEMVGPDNVITVGSRSMERREKEEADSLGLRYVPASKLKKHCMENIMGSIEWDRIYLSLDMDFFDPSFAPGVGNPEFFGLAPELAKECIDLLAERLVGFDVCETCPPHDNGNTSSLAARFVREVIGVVWKAKKNTP